MFGEKSEIPEFSACVDRGTLRVSAPTQVIFLCGGETTMEVAPPPLSFRDAFMRARLTNRLSSYEVKLAEEVVPFFPAGRYRDILSFEADIAQCCELTILYPESAGSFAELGAFSMEPEIASRMLTVMTRHFYEQRSFIRLGPVQLMEERYGRESIYVLDDARLRIPQSGSTRDLDVPLFPEAMMAAVDRRLGTVPDPSRFNPHIRGHVIKLTVGLIQHHGALTVAEVVTEMGELGIDLSHDDALNSLLCATFVGWLKEVPSGFSTFYAARNVDNAMSYSLLAGTNVQDRKRWRLDIRQFWKDRQPDRFASITSATVAA